MPNLYINVGNSLEVMYSPDSGPAHNIKYAISIVSYCLAGLLVLAIIFMYKKKTMSFD